MPRGRLKRAVAPLPSVVPLAPARPAKVLTVPSVATRRMVWLALSAT